MGDREREVARIMRVRDNETSEFIDFHDHSADWDKIVRTVAELLSTPAAVDYGVCPTCRRWQAYVGVYDQDGRCLRCHGCLRAVPRCRCR